MNDNRWSGLRSTLVLIAFAATACGSDSKGPEKAGPPATLTALSGSGQEGESGETLTDALVVKAVDAQGRPVPRALVMFAVTSGGGTLTAALDTTDAEGVASTRWTMGGALGAAQVTARVTGLITPAVFIATVKAGPPSVLFRVSNLIGSSAAGFETSDSVAIKVTDQFQHPLAGATVTFAVTGGNGTVSHATKTTGADGVARTAWKLGDAGAQTLRASLGALVVDVAGTAVACPERQIAVGEVLILDPAAASCLVSTSTGTQKYLISVTNSTPSANSAASFRVRGAGGGSVSAAIATSPSTSALRSGMSVQERNAIEQTEASVRTHAQLMRSNMELIEKLARARKTPARPSSNLVQKAPLPNVGDIVPVKIPLNFGALCSLSSAAQIGARVVYVGTRGVVLVDTATASNVAGTDEAYRAVGQQFDNSLYPILTNNFGNPLAMDAQTDQNDRLFMVFSHHVNEMQNGTVAGFVTSGDFDTSTCAASNRGEYFYARVPTVTGEGYASGTLGDWIRRTPTVIIHEVKHVTSFAEKLASAEPFASGYFVRDQWLEEGSAMMAEELWARTIFGYAQNSNTGYAASIYCEVRPTQPECQPTRPYVMTDHYFFLYQYLDNPEQTSAIGSTALGPSTFYGSGWMFLRWVIDAYATSESAFLRAMTLDKANPGTDNIVARTGKSFAELMSGFALAIALDDLPGFTPSNPRYSMPSWNTRDIYAGLNADFGSGGQFFQKAVPVKIRPASFGKFTVDVSSLNGGGFALFDLAGANTNKQLIEFGGAAGSGFPAEMRVAIVRVQ
jgi:hypothetical protein